MATADLAMITCGKQVLSYSFFCFAHVCNIIYSPLAKNNKKKVNFHSNEYTFIKHFHHHRVLLHFIYKYDEDVKPTKKTGFQHYNIINNVCENDETKKQ
jgi:hypothetical protein